MTTKVDASPLSVADAAHSSSKPPAHMPALNGLRGVAILLVLAHHSALATHDSISGLASHVVDLAMGFGWVGVDLFFVLSGFLITGILLATKDSPAYYKSFFARRFLRIFPLYYLLVFAVILHYHLLFTGFDVASLLLFYYNLQAAHLGHHLADVNSLWSLAVEEQFYILWPFIVMVLSRKALLRLCLAGIVLALLLRLIIVPLTSDFNPAYYLTPCRMDALLVGASLAILRTDASAWKRLQAIGVPVACVCSSALFGIALWYSNFLNFDAPPTLAHLRHTSLIIFGPGCSILAILFGALVVKCTRQGPIYNFFKIRVLQTIGKYSYGIYMLHGPLLSFLEKHVLSRMGKQPFDFVAIVGALMLLATSFAAAYVTFHLFERHFLSLKRLFPAVG